MNLFFTFLAFLIGILLPIQVGVNVELARYINSPILAAFVSFLVGAFCLIVIAFVVKSPFPTLGQIMSVPSWTFTGGLIGASVVFASIVAGPNIGALALVSLLLAGQLLGSVLIDHYGWLGFDVQKMDFQRLFGIVLLVGGFLLIRKY
ncbi:MAG: hypothetical protein CMH75_00160 [Nitrospina sp.]|nr:hypothetical protein [Nitrospina sp.]|tara:strand:+ start:279 stop:722 length:444 start_codon:yes stop_codon:yes gene_type:complete